jgi:DNA gyrase/topoisomerase IV subunit B
MMPKTLYRTTMDSTRRNLLKVVIPEGLRIETDRVMSDLMGKDPQRRFEFIMGSADMVQALDI